MAEDPNSQYVESLDETRQHDFLGALLGSDDEYIEIPPPFEGAPTGTMGTGGCLGHAREVLYEDLTAYARLNMSTGNIDAEAWLRVQALSEFHSATEQWRECINSAGYHADSIDDLLGQTARMPDEVSAAQAHAECLSVSGLRDVVSREMPAALEDIRAEREGEMIAISEIRQDAVERAKRILAESNGSLTE